MPSNQEGGETQLRKCLVDGFEMIKRHAEIEAAAGIARDNPEDVYGGFQPAQPPPNEAKQTWLDGLINKHMGGRREGFKVVWDIMEGKFAFDPWTGQLEKAG